MNTTLKRITEPEIMDDEDQVSSYFNADRDSYKYMFKIGYKHAKKQIPHSILDLGCGPGDLTYEIAEMYPDVPVTGIDASPRMLSMAPKAKNLTFKQQNITEVTEHYDRIISSLTLHHFHNPLDFWESIIRIDPRDIFIVDLLRPSSEDKIQERLNAGNYSPVYKRDFENSMRAAFTIDEIKEQVKSVGFTKLDIIEVDQFNLNMDLVLIAGAMLD